MTAHVATAFGAHFLKWVIDGTHTVDSYNTWDNYRTYTDDVCLTPGAHTLEITSGTLEPIRIAIVVQRAGDLGALGANAPWGLALAAALLIAIGGVVVILRRRFAMADGNGDGEN